MASTYIDPYQYQKAPTGLNTMVSGQMLGNLFRIAPCTAGATTLTVSVSFGSSISIAFNPYDSLYIFDGPKSEVVQVSTTTSENATSISLQGTGTTFAHALGTVCCSDGLMSLGQCLFDASAWLETICKQSLWQATYTGETLRMPSMRASIDNQHMLVFRPRHYPVTLESGISIEFSAGNSITYDQTQCILDGGKQIVTVPWLTVSTGGIGSGSTYSLNSSINRAQQLFLQITYQAGYVTTALPGDIQKAAILLTSDFVIQQLNPIGAADISQDKQRVTNALRGDFSGETLLYKQAKRILDNYTIDAF